MHAGADVQSRSTTEGRPDEPTGQAKPTRRSNEFYLARVGIAATVVLGLVGALLTSQASTRQISAESDRAGSELQQGTA